MFISHELSVVGQISDRIAVMNLGKIVEIADAGELYQAPLHPYTKALIDAVPKPDPKIKTGDGMVIGEPPSRLEPLPGCSFANRCPFVSDVCRTTQPVLREFGDARKAACHALD